MYKSPHRNTSLSLPLWACPLFPPARSRCIPTAWNGRQGFEFSGVGPPKIHIGNNKFGFAFTAFPAQDSSAHVGALFRKRSSPFFARCNLGWISASATGQTLLHLASFGVSSFAEAAKSKLPCQLLEHCKRTMFGVSSASCFSSSGCEFSGLGPPKIQININQHDFWVVGSPLGGGVLLLFYYFAPKVNFLGSHPPKIHFNANRQLTQRYDTHWTNPWRLPGCMSPSKIMGGTLPYE